jgi:DNA mismatch repair ATPase MutS
VKAHLLFPQQDFHFDVDVELSPHEKDLIQDLELTTLLDAMGTGDSYLRSVATRVLLTSDSDRTNIVYRQAVLADCLEHPVVIRKMYDIVVQALEEKRKLWGFVTSTPSSILSAAIRQLESGTAHLRALRRVADDHESSVRSDGLLHLFGALQTELSDDYFTTVAHHLKQLRFQRGVLISAELERDNSGFNFVLRANPKTRRSWIERIGIGRRSAYAFNIPPRDEAGAEALENLTNRALNLVANAAAQSADHLASFFMMLRAELGFYVGCINLHDHLDSLHAHTDFPEPLPMEASGFSATGLYDICLTLRSNKPAVANDVDALGRSPVIITGANSGGKSTFLRSVGIAQLMMQCGMFVAATSYRSGMVSGMFTHFIREEDPSMTRGRLDDELCRMSAIADQIKPHAMMLFNESFASTNEREGSEIGRQIVRAFLAAHITVLFVTHQYDFAQSFLNVANALFLRAERLPDGRRSYQLVVSEPLPTSYAIDLYYQVGHWLGEHGSIQEATELLDTASQTPGECG